jgi:protein TonB
VLHVVSRGSIWDEATIDGPAVARRKGRFGGALGTSIATHALLMLSFFGLMRVAPPVPSSRPISVFDPTRFVFTTTPGSQGDTAGGGNRSAEPPARLQTRPGGAVAIPAAEPTPLAAPSAITPEPPPSIEALMPVVPMDGGLLPQLGRLDGPSAPSTGARGPGDGGGERGLDGPGSGLRSGSGLDTDGGGAGGGVRPPQILYKTSPQYTTEAMRAKLQGVAILSGVVTPDGTLQQIKIARSLDGTFGLDQEAIKCVRQWRFRPGTRAGTPVAVAVTIEVAFNLR